MAAYNYLRCLVCNRYLNLRHEDEKDSASVYYCIWCELEAKGHTDHEAYTRYENTARQKKRETNK